MKNKMIKNNYSGKVFKLFMKNKRGFKRFCDINMFNSFLLEGIDIRKFKEWSYLKNE